MLELNGLSRLEEQLPSGRFFTLFPWEKAAPDPEMPSGAFLDALAGR